MTETILSDHRRGPCPGYRRYVAFLITQYDDTHQRPPDSSFAVTVIDIQHASEMDLSKLYLKDGQEKLNALITEQMNIDWSVPADHIYPTGNGFNVQIGAAECGARACGGDVEISKEDAETVFRSTPETRALFGIP